MEYNLETAKVSWSNPKGSPFCYKTTNYNLLIEGTHASLHVAPSEDKKDWIRNFKAWPKRVQLGNQYFYIHKGFYEAFKELKTSMLPQLSGIKTMDIRGVSLGGAIAQIYAIWIALETEIILTEVIPFASPKPFLGIGKGYKIAEALSFKNVNYILNADIVPKLPLFYKSVGENVPISTNKKPGSFLKWLIKPFTDHCSYWEELK